MLFTAYSAAQAQGMMFTDMDADNSGTVSEQEFTNAKNQRIAERAKEGRQMRGLANAPSFANIDANQDGKLTPNEMQSMQQTRGKRGMGKGQGFNNGANKGMGKGQRKMNRPPQPIFADFDANNDSNLTEQEFYDARDKRIAERAKEGRQMRGLANAPSFTDIDDDHNGLVSEQEFISFRSNHKGKGH